MYHCQAIGILHDRCLKPPTNSQARLAQRRAPIHHATARPPYWVICWRIVVRMSILVLFQILKDKLSAFTIESDFSCGLIISSLYHFEVSSFYTHSVESYHKGMLNFIKCFFRIYWDTIFALGFFDVMSHSDCFVDVDPPSHPWNELLYHDV